MDLKLDPVSGDIDISKGALVLLEGVDAIIQNLRIRLRFFLGEWFLDTRLGVPYFQKLLGQKLNKAAVQSIFRKAILGTSGVKKVSAIQVDYEGISRKLLVRFTATVTGTEMPIKFEEELII